MTTILKTASALAIAAVTLATFAATASAGITRGTGTITKAQGNLHAPASPAANHFRQIIARGGLKVLGGFGKPRLPPFQPPHTPPQTSNPSSGGTLIHCSPGTGCTLTSPGGNHDRWHAHWNWRGHYGFRSFPVVYSAGPYLEGCALEYKVRSRYVPGFGLRRVIVKACAVAI